MRRTGEAQAPHRIGAPVVEPTPERGSGARDQADASHSGDDSPRPSTSALARLEILDGLRSRRQLVVRTLTPLLLLLIVLGVTLLTRSTPGPRSDPYVVAVQGDIAGARQTLAQLSTDRLHLVPSADAAVDAARSADLGMVIPDALDAKIAKGDPVDVVLLETALAAESRSASAHVRAGFGAMHEQAVLREIDQGGAQVTPAPISIDAIDVQRGSQAASFETAGLVTAMILLQASMLVASTATRLMSRHNRGLLASQLLLPIQRWQLAVAKTRAELTVGTIAALPVLVACAIATIWTSSTRSGVVAGFASVAVLTLSYLMLAVLMCSVGLLVSTVCRTQEQVSLASAAVVVMCAVIASTVSLQNAPPVVVSRLIPVVGLMQSTQTTLLGWDGQAGWLVLGAATTLGLAAIVIKVAGGKFDAERLVLRGSS